MEVNCMWIYNGNEITKEQLDGYIGFVYIIENLKTNRKYIGKKLLKFSKTKQVKGKKKRIKVESDWPKYYGSNKVLLLDVNELGEQWFTRTILHLCKSKAEANYLEAYEQFNRNVLLRPTEFYNEYIRMRINRSHLKSLYISLDNQLNT